MQKLVLCLIFSLLSFKSFATKKRVLFIGNSYTYVNNLPQMVADVATSVNDTVEFDSYAPGGYTLQQHATDLNTINKIMTGNWDFVVLQEQSQLPAFPDNQVITDVFPYAKKLDSFIHIYNSCAETVFYMTWGYKNGDPSNCASFPPICTYDGMDSLLRLRYTYLADSNQAILSPVGATRHFIRINNPSIELYATDNSHPTVAGTYAAACTFYTILFRNDPSNISFNSSLNTTDAASIRLAAKTVAFDSLSAWNIGKYDPKSNFNYVVSGNTISFTNYSVNATTYGWNFGDGDTSAMNSPTHTYSSPGNYTVTLIASNCGQTASFSENVTISATGTSNIIAQNKISLYPNPVNDVVILKDMNEPIERCYISNSQGVIFTPNITRKGNLTMIDVSRLAQGWYLLKVQTNKGVFTERIIKE